MLGLVKICEARRDEENVTCKKQKADTESKSKAVRKRQKQKSKWNSNWSTGRDSLPSVGSKHHDSGECTPCFFLMSQNFCPNGASCEYCHCTHEYVSMTMLSMMNRQPMVPSSSENHNMCQEDGCMSLQCSTRGQISRHKKGSNLDAIEEPPVTGSLSASLSGKEEGFKSGRGLSSSLDSEKPRGRLGEVASHSTETLKWHQQENTMYPYETADVFVVDDLSHWTDHSEESDKDSEKTPAGQPKERTQIEKDGDKESGRQPKAKKKGSDSPKNKLKNPSKKANALDTTSELLSNATDLEQLRTVPGFDLKTFHRELANVLRELQKTGDADLAVRHMRAVPLEHQASEFMNILTRIAEDVSEEAHHISFVFAARLVGEVFAREQCVKGMTIFFKDVYRDLCFEVGGDHLKKVLSTECIPQLRCVFSEAQLKEFVPADLM